MANRRHRRPDAGVVGNVAGVVLRHVQIRANEHTFVTQIEIGHAQDRHGLNSTPFRHKKYGGHREQRPVKSMAVVSLVPAAANASAYFAFITATVVSSIRLENPHSLSYQEHTFTNVPSETLVSVESKIEEYALWLKST